MPGPAEPAPRYLFARALAAFLICPGVFAFLLPALLAFSSPRSTSPHWPGLALLAAGAFLLLWCVRDFYLTGRGTLAPWSPPQRLVEVGLYRYSRNPMYGAVLTVLCGWALTYRLAALWIYLPCVALAFHLRVVYGEEPWLARTHGQQWTEYRQRVPRWVV